MQRVIVTVRRLGELEEEDLEVPAETEAARLATLIAKALHWELMYAGQQIIYRIEAQPLGRTLNPDESLAEAGVWDGAQLSLYPTGVYASGDPGEEPPDPGADALVSASASQSLSNTQPLELSTPATSLRLKAEPIEQAQERDQQTDVKAVSSEAVVRWTALGIDLPTRDSKAVDLEDETPSPFSWKQLDD